MRYYDSSSGSGDILSELDGSGSAAAFQADHAITIADMTHVVDRTAKRYHLLIIAEGGANSIISPAADLVGFAFPPNGSTLTAGKWSCVATKAGTSQSASAGVTPTDNVYDDLEVEVTQGPGNTGGLATFYINGKPVGSLSAPVTMTVAMSPWIGFWQQDTGARYLDLDYVSIAATRDTGL